MAKKVPAGFREYLAEIGRKGGKKAGKTLTAEQRSARARTAAAARWKKDKPS
jgi:general stress protein YciG